MAGDITLGIDVEVDSSCDIRSAIINAIGKDPIPIKIKIDESALANSLKDINLELKIPKISLDASAVGSLQKQLNSIKLTDFKESKSSGSSKDSVKPFGEQVKRLEKSYSEFHKMYTKLFTKTPAESKIFPDLDNAAKKLDAIGNTIKKINSMQKDGSVKESDINALEKELQEYKQLSDAIEKTRKAEVDAAKESASAQRVRAAEVDSLINKYDRLLRNNTKFANTEGGQRAAANLELLRSAYHESAGNKYIDMDPATFAGLKEQFRELNTEMIKTGLAGDTLGAKFKHLFNKLGARFLITSAIASFTQKCREAVSAVVDIDTAMTELRRVTNESDNRYQEFLDGAASRALKTGSTIKETINATADFARLGYTLDEATGLADIAIMYRNVGDGISDVGEATQSIISTMKAFDMKTDESMHVVDAFDKTGNEYAISAAGVGESMQRSAAALAAANNSFEESIGLIVAANTTAQNPEKVGTTLKTVSMYLRAAKTEAEDAGESTDGMASSVSKLRDELMALTGGAVDIMKDNNTLKSTFQIFDELAGVWDKLTDITQANILEKIGGKRNANITAAIIQNWDLAKEAMQGAIDSEGTAVAENAKYLDSVEGRMQKFKTSFEEFSRSMVSTNALKGIVDFGSKLLNIFSNMSKNSGGAFGFLSRIGTLFAALNITATAQSGKNIFEALNLMFSNFGEYEAKTGIGRTIKDISTLISLTKEKGGGLTGFASAFKETFGTGGAIAVGATVALAAFQIVTKQIRKHQEKILADNKKIIDSAKESYSTTLDIESEDSVISLYDKYQQVSAQYESGAASKEEYTEATNKLASALGLEESAMNKAVIQYGSVANALKNVTEERINATKTDLTRALGAASQNATLSARKDNSFLGLGLLTREEFQNLFLKREFENKYADYSLQSMRDGLSEVKSQMEDMEDQAVRSGKSLSSLTDNKDYMALAARAKEYEGYLEDTLAIEKDLSQITAKEMVDKAFSDNNISSMRQYTKARKELYNQAKDSGDMFGTESERKSYIDVALESSLAVQDLIAKYGELRDVTTKYESTKDKLDIIPKKKLSDAANVFKELTEEIGRAEDANLDFNKTQYGNIDTNNRQLLQWSDKNLRVFSSQLKSWKADSKDMAGSVSTVFGVWDSFKSKATGDEVKIAFSPVLQGEDGSPKLLSASTMTKYLQNIVDAAGGDLSTENILKLDSKGMKVDGVEIKNMIAEIGDQAELVSEQMHFSGETGSFALLKGELQSIADEYGVTTKALLEYIDAQNMANNPNRLTNNDRGDLYKNIFGDTEGYAKQITELQSRITSLSSAYSNLVSGSMKTGDVMSLLQEFPELSPYVDLTADGFGHLADGLRTMINQSPDNLITELKRFSDTADLTNGQRAAIDGLISSLSQMPTDALSDITGEFGKFGESIINANSALAELKEELGKTDYDNNYDERVSALEGFEKEIESGNIGGVYYAAYKDYFGLSGKNEEEVKSWIQTNKKYFTEGADGIALWADKIREMNQSGELDTSIASFDDENGLQVDINKLGEFADAFGWTEEMMSDFIQKYRMYVSEFDWASHNPQETLTEWSQNGLIDKSGTAYMSELLDTTSMTKEEISGVISAINELQEENGREPIKLIDDTSGIAGAIKDLENNTLVDNVKSMFEEFDIPIHFDSEEGVYQVKQDVVDALEAAGAESSSILKFIEDGLNNGTIDVADGLKVGGLTLDEWNKSGKFEFEVETKDAVTNLQELKDKAKEAADALREDGVTNKKFNFDTESVRSAENEVRKAQKMVDGLMSKDGTLKCDASQYEAAQTVLEATIRQRDNLAGQNVVNLKVSTGDSERAVGRTALAVQSLYSSITDRNVNIGIHADTSEANAAIANTLSQLLALSEEHPEITAQLGISDALASIGEIVGAAKDNPAEIEAKINSGELDAQISSIKSSIEAITPTVWANIGLSPESLASLSQDGTISYTYTTTNDLPDHEDKTANIAYTYTTTNSVPSHRDYRQTITYTYQTNGKKPAPVAGTAHSKGSAFISGTAFKSGSWGMRNGGIGLIGELAPELLVRDGRYMLMGQNGAEFFRYKKNDVIFNAAQTEALLKYGGIRGMRPRGTAIVAGTAGSAFVGGKSNFISNKISGGITSGSSSSGSKSSSKSSSAAKSAADNEKSEFEKAYDYHQHLLKMEQEDEATYLAWLEQAYKDAYAQQKIELDDYYKYEEECFDKRKSIFEKSLKAQEHQIWLYAETMENKENAQVAVYQDMMKAVAAESRAARARGLTEEDEYIQELQKKYRDYMNKVEELRQQPYQNAISLIEKQIAYEEKGVEDSTKTRIQLTRQSIDIMNDALAAGRRRGLSETSEYMMDLKTKVREATNSIKEMIISSFSGFTSGLSSLSSAFSDIPGASQLVSKFYAMSYDANKRLLDDMMNDVTGLYSTQDKISQLANTISSYSAGKNYKKQLQENYDNALDALINQRMDQIKKANQKAIDEQSDALQDQIDALQDFYDKQIEMLEDEAEYEDYIKNQKEKRKDIANIEAALAQLELDNSAAAQKKKLQLRQQLADKSTELDEFEKDHARDTAKRQLEDERDAKIDALNEQLDAVRSYTEDEYAIRKQATADIMNMDNEQFQNYINGLIESGQMTESEAKKMVTNFLDTASAIGIAVEKLKAFQAMQEFSGWTGTDETEAGFIDKADKLAGESSKTTTTEKGEAQKSGKQVYDDALAAAGRAWNVAKASKDQGGMNASHQYAEAIRQTGYAITETEALAIAGRMWYNGAAYHTPMHAIAEELRSKGYKKHYAKGTAHASSGFAMFDELGTEYYFSKDGAKYKMMSAGDKVLNAKATDFLYNFATGKNSAIQELIERMSNANIGAGVESKVVAPIINMGDINVAGDASEHTVSEIRRAQRDQMNFIIKEFNKYSR